MSTRRLLDDREQPGRCELQRREDLGAYGYKESTLEEETNQSEPQEFLQHRQRIQTILNFRIIWKE